MTFLVFAIDSIDYSYSDVLISLVMAGVATLVASLVVFLWGLPVHFILSKLNYRRIIWYLMGAIPPSFVFIYVFKPFGLDSNIDLLQQALFCSFVGSLAAATFWYIAVYRQRITEFSSQNLVKDSEPPHKR